MAQGFTLRNQAYAESVQITKNLTYATGVTPSRLPPVKTIRGAVALRFDHCSDQDHSQVTDHQPCLAAWVMRHVSALGGEQTFLLARQPEGVKDSPQTSHRVDMERFNRSAWLHVSDRSDARHPCPWVPQRCPGSLLLFQLSQLL
ncbi:hypothetical protein ABZW50_32730, partial [Streptomyces bacillaris]